MIRTKLILIEGLPGAGKSVTAQQIVRQLHLHNINAIWFGEQQAVHPTNVDDASDIERFIQGTIERWESFVHEDQSHEHVTVLEGSLFQSFIRILFHHNVDPARIVAYGQQLETIIAPLHPVLVYLCQTNTANAVQRICDQRGPRWTSGYIATITSKPYASRHGLIGIDGVVQYWEAYRTLTDELYANYRMTKAAIATDGGDWAATMHNIYEVLDIVAIPEPVVASEDLERYAGQYRDRDVGHIVTIRVEQGNLYIDNFIWPTTKLLPAKPNVFAIQGWCFDLVFEEDRSGNIRQAVIGGRDVDFVSLVGHRLLKQDASESSSIG